MLKITKLLHFDWLRGMQLVKIEKAAMAVKMAVCSAMERFSLFKRLVLHHQLKIPCKCFEMIMNIEGTHSENDCCQAMNNLNFVFKKRG